MGNLHVTESMRRQGVGSALLATAAQWLRLARADRLLAYAEPDESDLVSFLKRSGFLIVTTNRRAWVQTTTVRPGVS
nr:GNAT family N-acetyltransferase [Pseudonocardia sp. ICBG1142]